MAKTQGRNSREKGKPACTPAVLTNSSRASPHHLDLPLTVSQRPHFRIDVHESCVDCGRSINFDSQPFEGVKKKPLAPGNSAFQSEMPDEVQHKPPVRGVPDRAPSQMGAAQTPTPVAHRCGGAAIWDEPLAAFEITVSDWHPIVIQ